jgi:hypothetical protein
MKAETLRDEQDLTYRLAALELAMRLRRLRERKGRADVHPEAPFRDPSEDLPGSRE